MKRHAGRRSFPARSWQKVVPDERPTPQPSPIRPRTRELSGSSVRRTTPEPLGHREPHPGGTRPVGWASPLRGARCVHDGPTRLGPGYARNRPGVDFLRPVAQAREPTLLRHPDRSVHPSCQSRFQPGRHALPEKASGRLRAASSYSASCLRVYYRAHPLLLLSFVDGSSHLRPPSPREVSGDRRWVSEQFRCQTSGLVSGYGGGTTLWDGTFNAETRRVHEPRVPAVAFFRQPGDQQPDAPEGGSGILTQAK